MASNVVNQIAYLRTSREFPENTHQLAVQMNKSYVDIANAVNSRIIGIFPVNRPAITGEEWFKTNNQKQQSLRQVFTFTSTTSIAHNIKFDQIDGFTRMFGQYTDGNNWYGLIPASNVSITGQISFYITPTNIVFVLGAGAPAVTNGRLVIEWLSDT